MAPENDTIEPGQQWTVDAFRPEDAAGVTALFKSVYGEGYPIRIYVEPDLLIAANAEKSVVSTVARTPKGDIVGHTALYNSAPNTDIYESGAALVHAHYRGGNGIFTEMVRHGIETASTDCGMTLAFGEPVCNHPFSQKLGRTLNFHTRAVEVDLMPASAYVKEKSAAGRVSALLSFRTIQPKPQTIYIPQAYETDFDLLYANMDDTRTFRKAEAPLPPATATCLSHQIFDFARVARITVKTVGHDLEAVLTRTETTLSASGIAVVQIWLPLADPTVGAAVDLLRRHGYFIGGVLPRWFDHDAMLMQKLTATPNWEGMVIAFDEDRRLVERVKSDWERAVGETLTQNQDK